MSAAHRKRISEERGTVTILRSKMASKVVRMASYPPLFEATGSLSLLPTIRTLVERK